MARAFSSIEMIGRLVAFDTTSRESNLALIDFVRDYLDGSRHRQRARLRPRRAARPISSPPSAPADRGGIMLSGHTDVVPVDGQAWDGDPFAVAERDGTPLRPRHVRHEELHRRRAGDGAGLHRREARDADPSRASPMTRRSAASACAASSRRSPGGRCKPRLCIIGEPTSMQPVVAHKGKRSLRCHVHGHESHSALAHAGVNAVEIAADIVAQIRRIARQKRDEGPFDAGFTPPYTTVHTGTHRRRHRAQHRAARMPLRFRDPPSARRRSRGDRSAALQRHADALLPEMHGVSPATGIAFEEYNAIPALATPADSEVVAARAVAHRRQRGRQGRFGTEGGLYQQAGIPTVICGPGSIEQAHRPNELIALDQVRQCEDFLRRLDRSGWRGVLMAAHRIEIAPPDIERLPRRQYRHRLCHHLRQRPAPARMSCVNALTHGNEICGAIALDRLFQSGIRPARGKLTLPSPMSRAYRAFDRANPDAVALSRRGFQPPVGRGDARRPAPQRRARRAPGVLRPLYDSADLLLDIHSMQYATAPLMLIGLAPKTEAFARTRRRARADGARRRPCRRPAPARLRAPSPIPPRRRSRSWSNAASIGSSAPPTWRSTRPGASSPPRACWPTPAATFSPAPAPPQRLIAVTDVGHHRDRRFPLRRRLSRARGDRQGRHGDRPRRRPRHPHAL